MISPFRLKVAWLNTPKNQGGIQGVTYPIVADLSKSISESFGVLAGSYAPDENGNWVCEGTPVAYRGLFLIDKEGVVRHSVITICHSDVVWTKPFVW
jgi:peroxiredoxin (alkyl hydroperoxide reductase subunit C)